MIRWHQINFPALDHMEVNAYFTPPSPSSSSVSIYPWWPLCTGELSPSGAGMGLWLWGAAGWGCCTPEGLLHLWLTSPSPLRVWKHAHGSFLASLAASLRGAWRPLCPRSQLIHTDDPKLWSGLRLGTQRPFVMMTIVFFCLTFGLEKAETSWVRVCSSAHVMLWNHARSFMLRDTSGEHASILVSPHCKVATQQLSSASAQLSRVVYRSKVGRFGWLLQNATNHLLVIASICRETPPKNLKFPSTLSSFFFFFPPPRGALPLLPLKPTSRPRTSSHCVCGLQSVGQGPLQRLRGA